MTPRFTFNSEATNPAGVSFPMELRDLPAVDELARAIDDPLAIDAARAVLDRARGGDPRRRRSRRPRDGSATSSQRCAPHRCDVS
jgi:hypothetical protein